MVLLEFQVDEGVVARNRQSRPETQHAGVLQETFFEMPIRLRVADVELLEWQGGGYPLPLLHMATMGLSRVRRLEATAKATLRLPGDGDLFLDRSGDEVMVSSTQTPLSGHARYEELLRAWEEFASKVREFLLSEFPELETHPFWGEWFRGKDLPWM